MTSKPQGTIPRRCLGPATEPCAVSFIEGKGDWTSYLTPNLADGVLVPGDTFCKKSDYASGGTLDNYDTVDFGGRDAEYRQYTWQCVGERFQVTQWVVPTVPAIVLSSHSSDQQIRDGLRSMVAHSELPAQTAPLWLVDEGVTRSVRPVPGGWEVELDRFISTPDQGPINKNPQTYTYVVPSSTTAMGLTPRVGLEAYVGTNGTTVTSFNSGAAG